MATTSISSAARLTATHAPRRFFFLFGLALLVLVFAGFAPSFYVRPFINLPGMLPTPFYVYMHGLLMTVWYVLLVVQTGLVARGRRDLHRALGTAGVAVAAAIVPMGWATTVLSASRIASLTGMPPEQLIAAFSLDRGLLRGVLGLALFAACVTIAVLRRKQWATHGRLMLLAGVAASGAALAPTRMVGAIASTMLPSWLLAESVAVAVAVLALVLYDWRTLRRVHTVTLIVGPLLLLIVPLAAFIADTNAGHAWIMGLFDAGH
jgi:hypothetical protein